jgi:hypothetical protein
MWSVDSECFGSAGLTSASVILPRLMNHLREVSPGALVDYSNFSTQTIKLMPWWHARADKVAGNRWLRGVIAELFNDAPRRSAPSASGGIR